VRDEKSPQILANVISPVSADGGDRMPAENGDPDGEREAKDTKGQRSIFVKVPDEGDPRYERLQLVLTMFPGGDRLVAVLGDGRRLGARCVAHDALVQEARELFGAANVAVR
jgi:hypothetical protein